MKKILFLLLLSVSIYGQTYQNPTFGTVTTKTSPTVTNDPYLTTTGTTGIQGKIAPVNVLIPYTPINYTISGQTIGQQIAAIDAKIGTMGTTSAGVTQTVYFTADNTVVNSVTYFASSLSGKGSTASGSPPALVLADNTKAYFTKDVISIAQPAPTIGYAGTYRGNLTVSASPTPVATQQRFTVEIYRTDNLGVPIASGVSGAPVGDLGVTVLAILDSGIINLTAGAITNIAVSGVLTQNITLNTGERLRYHVSAAKIGTGGGNVTFGVYYGTSYNSYYDVPVAITTDAVLNKSAVPGAVTNTDALNFLNTNKANDASVLHKTGALAETADGLKTFTEFVTSNSGMQVKALDYATTVEKSGIANDTEQGYAFDGTHHYLIGINVIRKYDLSWNLILSNTNILSGIPGTNHTGDGVCLGGFLYVPVETFPGTPNGKIARFNTSTLALDATYDISAQGHESSGLTTDGTYFYIVDYNNGAFIWKYDLVGNFISTITIAKPFTNNIQSLSYYAGNFYVIEQTQVSKLSLDGLTNTFLFNSPGLNTNSHRGEAIQVVSGVARILAFTNLTFSSLSLYYVNLTPTVSANNAFYVNNAGLLKTKRAIINEENDAPSIVALDVYGKQSITTNSPDPFSLKIQNKSTLGTSNATFQDDTGNKYLNVGVNNSAHTLGITYGNAGEAHVRSSVASNGLVVSTVNGDTRFITTNSGTEQMRIFGASGNLVLQNGGTFTDLPSKFRINGNVNAMSGFARGSYLTPTLTAIANNDFLAGLDIAPTFVTGAFTGVLNYGARVLASTPHTLVVRNPNTSTYSGISVQDDTATKSLELVFRNSASSSGASYGFIGEGGIRSSANAIGLFLSATSGHIRFINGTGTERGRFFSGSGNFIVQSGGTFTDNGNTLQVTGNASGTLDATNSDHFVRYGQITSLDATNVKTTGNQNIAGDKTFTGNTTSAGITINGATPAVQFSTAKSSSLGSTTSIARIGSNVAIIGSPDTGKYGILFDNSLLTTADRTYTYPNASGTIALTSDISSAASSGTYTPTAVAGTNVTSITAPTTHTYTKIGNIVTVYGYTVPTLTTTAIDASYTITLPIARANTGTFAIGFGATDTPANTTKSVFINSSTTTTATIMLTSTLTGGVVCRYSFQYDVTQ